MKLLLDMNLAPEWVEFLRQSGFEATHWSAVGDHRASDAVLLDWARAHDQIVVTHDLGFSALLALSRAKGPRVVLIRAQDVLPAALGSTLVRVLTAHRSQLVGGAVLSVDEAASRVRILPLGPTPSGA